MRTKVIKRKKVKSKNKNSNQLELIFFENIKNQKDINNENISKSCWIISS